MWLKTIDLRTIKTLSYLPKSILLMKTVNYYYLNFNHNGGKLTGCHIP